MNAAPERMAGCGEAGQRSVYILRHDGIEGDNHASIQARDDVGSVLSIEVLLRHMHTTCQDVCALICI